MHKIIAVALFAVALTGCETSSQARSMADKGAAEGAASAFSCTEISKAFTAYEMDRESVNALAVIAPLISASSGTMTSAALTTTDEYYAQAKASVGLALLVQGCAPLT